MAHSAANEMTQAEPAFRQACHLNPLEENACYYLARTLFAQARFGEALEAYQVALENGSASRGRVLLGIALAHEAMSRPAEAERYYREAIAAGERQASVDYGLFLFKNGRSAESLAVLERAGATAELSKVHAALAAAPAGHAVSEPAPISFDERPLPMRVRNGATGDKHLIETMIAGVAVFDYDNDGWPDIFIANGAAIPSLNKPDASYYNRLFRNNHDGTFTDITEQAGVAGSGFAMGAAAADFDNDGNVDLFVTGVRSNALYRNRGDGTFEDVTAKAGLGEVGKWPVAAGWFDFDNDGLLDLFVVRYVDWNAATETRCGGPGYRQYCNPSEYRPLSNALYRNLGNGKFQDVSTESGIADKLGKGMGLAFGDFDGDGRMDVFVANDTMPDFLFHNEGGGRFKDVALEAGVAYNGDGKAISSMGVDFRDFDNDGREDLFVTALSDETFPLFRNIGNGRFADVTYPSGIGRASTPWTGWSTGMFDFNNDGWKDLFVAGGHVMDNSEASSGRKSRQPNLVFVNRGAGHFQGQVLPGEALHRGAAFGDFDRDGRIDVVVTRLNESPVVLRNTTQGGNWIAFRLIGHKSNRDGIGALVHIASASGEQWNRVTTCVGYGGSSDRVVHFGLGGDAVVKSVKISWPFGITQELDNISVNRFVTIEEAQ